MRIVGITAITASTEDGMYGGLVDLRPMAVRIYGLCYAIVVIAAVARRSSGATTNSSCSGPAKTSDRR
jgi:hypothetical protein